MTIDQIKRRFGIVGRGHSINTAVEIAMRVAPTEVTVLITGENGTGKDAFSRIIHQFSKRKHKSFIAINCGAIPKGTLESELFGHEKGSFTSAYESRKGYFEEANDGTIFLDEIAEMPLETQSQLLRLLENGEFLRVGSSQVRKTNVRVVAATNKNLVELIRQGKFREDLFFRLNTINIHMPPLRDRGDDIELLFQYFSLEFSEKYQRNPIELEPEAITLLLQYRWPGNVRELRNLVEKLTVLIKEDEISAEILRDSLLIQETYLPTLIPRDGFRDAADQDGVSRQELDQLYKLIYNFGTELSELKNLINRTFADGTHPDSYRDGPMATPQAPSPSGYYDHKLINPEKKISDVPLIEESLSLEKKEQELIKRALDRYHNNRKKAAEALGISERTLYRKIKIYDIVA